MSEVAAGVERLTALTDAIQEAMDAGDWQAAAGLAAERLDALRALFAPGGADGAGPVLLETLLLESQRETYRLIGEVDHHRRRLQREAELEAAGQHAVERYAATSRETF